MLVKGCGELLLSGLSVTDSPLLSDRCCRHRSMHHTFVSAPLLRPPPFPPKVNPAVSPCVYLRAHRTPLQDVRGTHIHTHTGDGDKSWLSRFPSVSHGAESHLPLTDGSAGCAAVLSGDRGCGIVRFSPVIRMESRSVVPKLWGARPGTLQNKQVTLTRAAWLSLSH